MLTLNAKSKTAAFIRYGERNFPVIKPVFNREAFQFIHAISGIK